MLLHHFVLKLKSRCGHLKLNVLHRHLDHGCGRSIDGLNILNRCVRKERHRTAIARINGLR